MFNYIINAFIVFMFYLFTYIFLEDYNITFRRLELNKRLYVVKNLVKSFNLGYISIVYTNTLVNYIMTNKYDMLVIRDIASFYVSNDIIALIVVPNLPMTTKIHHSITSLLLGYTIMVDYNDVSNPGKLLLIYTLLSCYSFLVNFYLGIRFLEQKNTENKLIKYSRVASFYTYATCCIVNWTIQCLVMLYRIINLQYNLHYLAYTGLLYFIVKDDLILMSWLKN